MTNQMTHEERCERIREIESGFATMGEMAVEIYRLRSLISCAVDWSPMMPLEASLFDEMRAAAAGIPTSELKR